jgi:hypothetical protein
MNDTDRLDYLERLDYLTTDQIGAQGTVDKLLSLLGPLNRGVPLRQAIDEQMGADQEFYSQRERELVEAQEEEAARHRSKELVDWDISSDRSRVIVQVMRHSPLGLLPISGPLEVEPWPGEVIDPPQGGEE